MEANDETVEAPEFRPELVDHGLTVAEVMRGWLKVVAQMKRLTDPSSSLEGVRSLAEDRAIRPLKMERRTVQSPYCAEDLIVSMVGSLIALQTKGKQTLKVR